ncbi:MAG: hypothetical protein CM15mP70_00790 [Pelagibacteraceae bacterium]|nr:MAG: hypothetical protein CM15mP70_00790 [Pelagibacteraceae bacterium]
MALWDITSKHAKFPYKFVEEKTKRSSFITPLHVLRPIKWLSIAREKKKGLTQFNKLGADANWQNDVGRLVKVREAVVRTTGLWGLELWFHSFRCHSNKPRS